MGLGPPVCTKCRVIRLLNEYNYWACPSCGKRAGDEGDYECLWDLNKDEQNEYEKNTEEYKDG